MGRKASVPILSEAIQIFTFIGQVALAHPFYTMLFLTAAYSTMVAFLNGQAFSLFSLTYNNILSIIGFFMDDLNSMCFNFVLEVCLPAIVVSAFNLIKLVAFIIFAARDLFPVYKWLWEFVFQMITSSR